MLNYINFRGNSGHKSWPVKFCQFFYIRAENEPQNGALTDDYYTIFLSNTQHIKNLWYEIHSLCSVLAFCYILAPGYRYQNIDNSVCQEAMYSISDWFHWTINWYSVFWKWWFSLRIIACSRGLGREKTFKTLNFVSVPCWNGLCSFENEFCQKIDFFFQYNTWGF